MANIRVVGVAAAAGALALSRVRQVRQLGRLALSWLSGGPDYLPNAPLCGDSELMRKNRCAIAFSLLTGDERFGDGRVAGFGPVDQVDWRDHLFEAQSPQSMLHEVGQLVSAGLPDEVKEDPTRLSFDQITEGVRRCLCFLNPELCVVVGEDGRGSRKGLWNRAQCEAIARSLLSENGVVETGRLVSSASDRGGGAGVVSVQSPALEFWRTRAPVHKGPWLTDAMTLLHAAGRVLFDRAAGHRSHWCTTPCGLRVHYHASAGPLPAAPPAHPHPHPQPPPLVLVHGMHTTAACWILLAPLLALTLTPKRQVVSIDLPGFDFGFSPSAAPRTDVDASPTLDQHVAAIRAVIDDLGCSSMDLVGHSYGGIVTATFSRRHPSMVRRLALLAPFGVGLHRSFKTVEDETLMALQQWGPVLGGLGLLSLESTLLPLLLDSQDLQKFMALDRRVMVSPKAGKLGEDSGPPTLLIWGKNDSVCVPQPEEQIVRPFSSQQTTGRGTEQQHEQWWVENTDHALTVESVVAVADLLKAFLRKADDEHETRSSGGAPQTMTTTLAERFLRALLFFTAKPVTRMTSPSSIQSRL